MRAIIDELVIELLVNTGLRASELCSLNIGDLPMAHGKDAVWVRDGKGSVARTVDIPEVVQKRLERFVKLYRKAGDLTPRVEAVMGGAGGQYQALIGDDLVSEGATVQSYRVRKIQTDRVEFEKDGQTWVQKVQ